MENTTKRLVYRDTRGWSYYVYRVLDEVDDQASREKWMGMVGVNIAAAHRLVLDPSYYSLESYLRQSNFEIFFCNDKTKRVYVVERRRATSIGLNQSTESPKQVRTNWESSPHERPRERSAVLVNTGLARAPAPP